MAIGCVQKPVSYIFENYKARKYLLGILYLTLGVITSMYHFTVKRDMQTYGLSLSDINIKLFIAHFPWQVKFLPAIFCDIVPLCGRHRKPYIVTSLLCAVVSVAFLTSPIPGVNEYVLCLFMLNLFVSIADVNYDACIVEDSRAETSIQKGNLQTSMWYCRFIGEAAGDIGGPILWSRLGSNGTFAAVTITATLGLVSGLFLADSPRSLVLAESHHPSGKIEDFNIGNESPRFILGESGSDLTSRTKRRHTFLNGLQLIKKTIFSPFLRLVLLYNLLTSIFPSASLAMFFYITDDLKFTPEQMSVLGLCGAAGKLIGMGVFKLLKPYNVQQVFLFTSGIGMLLTNFSLLVTIKFSNHLTAAEIMGFDLFWCAILDDVIGDAMEAIRFMCIIIISNMVCERAVEAGSYSTILSLMNISGALKKVVESALMRALNIDSGHFTNLSFLLVICLGFKLLSFLMIVPLIPDASIHDLSDRVTLIREQEPAKMQAIRQTATTDEVTGITQKDRVQFSKHVVQDGNYRVVEL